MRKVSCRVCGEKWSGRRGPQLAWYFEHLRRHDLKEPKREEGEDIDDYLDRLTDWRNEYFDDSLYPYWKSLHKKKGTGDHEEPGGIPD